jgi:hypothetical protein
MAARRRGDRRRDDLCAVALRKRVVNWSSVRSDCYDAESIPIALAGLTSSEFPTCLRKLQCRRNEWLRALIQACGAGCHYVLRDTQCDRQRSLGKAPVLASGIFFLSAVERPAKISGRQAALTLAPNEQTSGVLKREGHHPAAVTSPKVAQKPSNQRFICVLPTPYGRKFRAF